MQHCKGMFFNMNINKTIESTKEPRISVAPMMDWQ